MKITKYKIIQAILIIGMLSLISNNIASQLDSSKNEIKYSSLLIVKEMNPPSITKKKE